MKKFILKEEHIYKWEVIRMKWETYKDLIPELKEEYQFKFGVDKLQLIKPSSLTITSAMFISILTVFICIIYMSATTPALAIYKERILEVLQLSKTIIFAGTLCIILEAIIIICIASSRIYQEHKWKKKNGIIKPWYK